MNKAFACFIAQAERDAQSLAELVWDAAHHTCARLTHDLPEATANELSELHLEETLRLLGADVREQVRYLVKTLGEAEAFRRLNLAFDKQDMVAA